MYLVLVLIPLCIAIIGNISMNTSEKYLKVGILEGAMTKKVTDCLDENEYIRYETADKKTVNTDLIMKKYDYIIDGANPNAMKEVDKLSKLYQTEHYGQINSISSRERILSVYLTVYMVIATLYASKMIQDKKMGVIDRICYSGTNKKQYYFGFFGFVCANILLQTIIGFLVIHLWNKDFLPNSIGAIIGSVLFITIFASLYGILHAVLYKTEMSANIMSSSVAIMLSIIGGTFVGVEQMPKALQVISAISPIRWLIDFI